MIISHDVVKYKTVINYGILKSKYNDATSKKPIEDDEKEMLNYISQQEMKDKLLELYKKRSMFVYTADGLFKDMSIESLDFEIKEIEESLT